MSEMDFSKKFGIEGEHNLSDDDFSTGFEDDPPLSSSPSEASTSSSSYSIPKREELHLRGNSPAARRLRADSFGDGEWDGEAEFGSTDNGRNSYRQHMSHVRMILLSSYWFARATYYAALLIIIFPQIVETTFPFQYKYRALGLLSMFASFITIVVAPVCGYKSDKWKTKNKYGRRLPFLIFTTLCHVITLTIIGFAAAIIMSREEEDEKNGMEVDGWTMILFSFVVILWSIDSGWDAAAVAPYSALIPELVALEQVGSASGWMGFATMMGNVVGVVMAAALYNSVNIIFIFWFICTALVLGTLGTVYSNDPKQNERLYNFLVREEKRKQGPNFGSGASRALPPPNHSMFRRAWDNLSFLSSEFLEPFKFSTNFCWVFASRFLMMTSFGIMTTFLQFYLQDVVGVYADGSERDRCTLTTCEPTATMNCTTPDIVYHIAGGLEFSEVTTATSMAASCVLFGSLFSSLIAGVLSDYYGRKIIVYSSGLLQGLVVLAMAFVWRYDLVLLLLILFGFGYGAFISVDWALASDALPSTGNYAKDMGVWNISLTLPTVVGPPVAGYLIDVLNKASGEVGIECFGYRIVFFLCFVLYIISVWLIKHVTTTPVQKLEAVSEKGEIDIEMDTFMDGEDDLMVPGGR